MCDADSKTSFRGQTHLLDVSAAEEVSNAKRECAFASCDLSLVSVMGDDGGGLILVLQHSQWNILFSGRDSLRLLWGHLRRFDRLKADGIPFDSDRARGLREFPREALGSDDAEVGVLRQRLSMRVLQAPVEDVAAHFVVEQLLAG